VHVAHTLDSVVHIVSYFISAFDIEFYHTIFAHSRKQTYFALYYIETPFISDSLDKTPDSTGTTFLTSIVSNQTEYSTSEEASDSKSSTFLATVIA